MIQDRDDEEEEDDDFNQQDYVDALGTLTEGTEQKITSCHEHPKVASGSN